jgi:hypothetical protein
MAVCVNFAAPKQLRQRHLHSTAYNVERNKLDEYQEQAVRPITTFNKGKGTT